MLFLKIPAVKKKFNIPDQIIHTPEDFKPKGFREGWREGTFISNFSCAQYSEKDEEKVTIYLYKVIAHSDDSGCKWSRSVRLMCPVTVFSVSVSVSVQ